MPSFQSLILALTCSLLFACVNDNGKVQKPSPPPAPYIAGNIKMDHGVPEEQRKAFISAYENLDSNPMREAEPELLTLLKTKDASPQSIKTWIEERTQYIIPENANIKQRAVEMRKNWTYENPGIIPEQFSNKHLLAKEKAYLVMANMGALLYIAGKKLNSLIGLEVNGHGVIGITSPRTGILIIGEGFSKTVAGKYSSVAAPFHVATLAHESRHSDGSGKNIGFIHTKCPDGHDYEGYFACDSMSNGPYKIDALIIKSYYRSCADCSLVKKELLKALYIDTESRVLPTATAIDDRHEGRR